MSTPGNRCGFTLSFEDAPHDISERRLADRGPFQEFSCWRETWRDHDKCIWHAETNGKPLQELINSRTDNPERLDGAYLCGSKIGDYVSFSECTLHYAEFDGAYLEGADFSESVGGYTSFKGANICHTSFHNAVYYSSDFSESNAQSVNASEASFTDCDFSEGPVDGSFREADLMWCDLSDCEIGIDFSGGRLAGVDFSRSLLSNCNLKFVSGSHCDFSEARVGRANFSYSDMAHSNFESASISDCMFWETDLENCTFSGASVSGTDFRRSDLYGSLFENLQVDSSTKFGDHYLKPDRPLFNVESIISLNELWASKVTDHGGESQSRLLEKRAWTLQALEDIFRRNSRHEAMRRVYLLRKENERERDRMESNWAGWLFATGSKYFAGYGEKPMSIIYSSAFTIVLFALGYTIAGGVVANDIGPIGGVGQDVSELITNLYFSSMTFTGLGYGDLQPATWSVRILSTIEAILGALLTALLIFVLGRRTVR